MNFEFMTIDTPLPPCMPFPRALTGFPVSSTAKVMYCRMLDAMLSKGQEDENGILFVCFPVTAIAAVLSRSPMTVKRSLNTGNRRTYHAGASGRGGAKPDLCADTGKGGRCPCLIPQSWKNSTGSWRKAKRNCGKLSMMKRHCNTS